MVLLSIVAVWLVVALVLGVTVGRSIRRADTVELAAHASWDADRRADSGADRVTAAATSGPSTASDPLPRSVPAHRAA